MNAVVWLLLAGAVGIAGGLGTLGGISLGYRRADKIWAEEWENRDGEGELPQRIPGAALDVVPPVRLELTGYIGRHHQADGTLAQQSGYAQQLAAHRAWTTPTQAWSIAEVGEEPVSDEQIWSSLDRWAEVS